MGAYDFVAKSELIGSEMKVIDSKNKNLIGMEGKIIDETRNMLIMETKKGNKNIIKSEVKIRLKMEGKIFDVDGKILVGRPEDRIKKIRGIK